MGTHHRCQLALTTIALAASAFVIAAYVLDAAALVAYPWDWSPDEGLYLDYARRLVQSPASLNLKSFVPFPSAYGPGLPALLAPAVLLGSNALAAARLVMLGCALLASWATYTLARQACSRPLSLAAAALALAPFDLTFWHVLVRTDGPMLTFWLLTAVAVLPRQLTRGADALSAQRIALGVAFLLAAALTKQTAVLHGAPLVLGWWWVDRRSAVRLASSLALAGLVVVLALQWATSGGFLWANRVWGLHAWQPAVAVTIVLVFIHAAWPALLVGAVALEIAVRRGAVPQATRDASLLLVVGGLAALPLTGKFGAWWNYLLPLVPALAVVAARATASAWTRSTRRPQPQLVAAAVLALAALVLALTREFPLPTAEDERTAGVLYGYVRSHTRETGGPILAIRPELAYVVVGQSVEMEGSGYIHIATRHAPGTDLIVRRLASGTYTLAIVSWPMPPDALAELSRSYADAGGCSLGYYYGRSWASVFPRRDVFRPMPSVAGARCSSAGR
jgi:4-amino-4-deoxy-L-arabinose transferase-like glycosyltransferase